MVILLLILMIGTAWGVGWILKRVREKIDYENSKLEEKYGRQDKGGTEKTDH